MFVEVEEGEGAGGGIVGCSSGLGFIKDVDQGLIKSVDEDSGAIRAEIEASEARTRAVQQRARRQVVQQHVQVEQLEEMFQQW